MNEVSTLYHLAGIRPPTWHALARCAEVDPELFFPERGGDPGPAKRVCLGCEVRTECLSSALAIGEPFGIWGGLTARERRQLRRPRTTGRPAAVDPGPVAA